MKLVLSRHGDMLYMTLEERAGSAASMESEGAEAAASFSAAPSVNTASGSTGNGFREDEVDVLLSKQDGKIYRDRNEQLWVLLLYFVRLFNFSNFVKENLKFWCVWCLVN